MRTHEKAPAEMDSAQRKAIVAAFGLKVEDADGDRHEARAQERFFHDLMTPPWPDMADINFPDITENNNEAEALVNGRITNDGRPSQQLETEHQEQLTSKGKGK